MRRVTCVILGGLLIIISILGFLAAPAFQSAVWVNIVEIAFGALGVIVGLWKWKPKNKQPTQ